MPVGHRWEVILKDFWLDVWLVPAICPDFGRLLLEAVKNVFVHPF